MDPSDITDDHPLGHPSELDDNTLLLETLHTRVIQHREIKPVLAGKLHPLWLALTEREGATRAMGGTK